MLVFKSPWMLPALNRICGTWWTHCSGYASFIFFLFARIRVCDVCSVCKLFDVELRNDPCHYHVKLYHSRKQVSRLNWSFRELMVTGWALGTLYGHRYILDAIFTVIILSRLYNYSWYGSGRLYVYFRYNDAFFYAVYSAVFGDISIE